MANSRSNMSVDYSPWGLDNRTPIGSAIPGIISVGGVGGAPAATTAPWQPASLGLGTSASLGTGCTNCFAVPRGAGQNFNPINGGVGPTAPFSASTLNWTTFAVGANGGSNGTRNEFNPYSIAWFDAAQQRNGGAMTIDQRLTRNITVTGGACDTNRRAEYLNPENLSPSSFNEISTAVPTFNPYYPTGGAPTNLRVNYVTAYENPSFTMAYELADRYSFGLNIDLPGGWSLNPYFAETYDSSFNHVTGSVNRNAVSAALGWTIAASAATGTSPGIATWTKPATVPYLNLFCDPTQFKCNSDNTLSYVTGTRSFNEKYWINEKGVKADGLLFSLPGGDVKAAIGANLTSYTFGFTTFDNTGAPSLVLPLLTDAIHRTVWAVFSQVNVPVIGQANALTGIRKFELEGSWRHDQYSDVGGTSNPKVAFNWNISEDAGLTVRGSWGTSFRAPGFGETSPLANNNVQAWNTASFPTTQSQLINITCNADVGSAGYKLSHPTVGPAIPCTAPTSSIVGVSLLGSATTANAAHFRDFINTSGQRLTPETSQNWSIGG